MASSSVGATLNAATACTISVNVPHEQLADDETLVAVGNCDALGQWNHVYGPELTCVEDDRWEVAVDLPTGVQHTYRLVVVEKATRVVRRWETHSWARLLCPGMANVARGQAAKQSSVYRERGPHAGTNGNIFGGVRHPASTLEEDNPWWEVDLGEPYPVSTVALWLRPNLPMPAALVMTAGAEPFPDVSARGDDGVGSLLEHCQAAASVCYTLESKAGQVTGGALQLPVSPLNGAPRPMVQFIRIFAVGHLRLQVCEVQALCSVAFLAPSRPPSPAAFGDDGGDATLPDALSVPQPEELPMLKGPPPHRPSISEPVSSPLNPDAALALHAQRVTASPAPCVTTTCTAECNLYHITQRSESDSRQVTVSVRQTINAGTFGQDPFNLSAVGLDHGWLGPGTSGIVRLVINSFTASRWSCRFPDDPFSVSVSVSLRPFMLPSTVPAAFRTVMDVVNGPPDSIPMSAMPLVVERMDSAKVVEVPVSTLLSPWIQVTLTAATATMTASTTLLPIHFPQSLGTLRLPLTGVDGSVVDVISGSFAIILPFRHPNNNLSHVWRRYWKKRPMLRIGHRGVGRSFKQAPGSRKAALKENTLVSFATAGKMGAEYIEFDVLLTADRVPVVYHDFELEVSLAEELQEAYESFRLGIHQLSWRALRRVKTHHLRDGNKGSALATLLRKHLPRLVEMGQQSSKSGGGASGAGAGAGAGTSSAPAPPSPAHSTTSCGARHDGGTGSATMTTATSRRPVAATAAVGTATAARPPQPSPIGPATSAEAPAPRPSTVSVVPDSGGGKAAVAGAEMEAMAVAMALTAAPTATPPGLGARSKPRPAASRLVAALYSIPTLQALFETVPGTVGFDVEIKYPVEARHERLLEGDPALWDLNSYLDTILSVVFEHAGPRRIVFTCFHPEIVVALRAKQARYPVLFLTEGGTNNTPFNDLRCQSLSAAISHSVSEGLQGIVASSRALVAHPDEVRRAQASDLLVFGWGDYNNDPAAVEEQERMGVDAVIADNIGDHIPNKTSQFW